jgi:hypothetical protein
MRDEWLMMRLMVIAGVALMAAGGAMWAAGM